MPPCAAASPLRENIPHLQGACVHIAIYHFEAKVISRGSGRSAVAAAAYQSGSKLYNDYTGLTHDYRKKGGVLYSEILLPEQAPKDWQDRQTFWNAVEQAEKTKDSRLARQLIVALPAELEQADWKTMLHGFIRRQCVDMGMCADWAIHDPDGRNPHAHIMLTMRPLDRNGHWQAKTQKEYLCRRGQVADRCEINRQIKADNKLLREMQCEGSADVERLEKHLRQLDEISEKLAAQQSRLTDEWRSKLDAFDGARRGVTGRTKTKELLQERARLRPGQRKALAARLQKQEGEHLDDGLARWAETLVDDALGYEESTVQKLEFSARMRKDTPKQEHAAKARRQQELSL